ncbi:MFS transporter [Pectinatus frisingensis]|uniref:MFS transporter n=1 Tax=Pectinatus frisingensis TaxID=865 RepID=UPI0018C83688|nr:MFS transporter [Pectinatus frisingensis]
MLKWFLTGANKPRIKDETVIKQMYHSARMQSVSAMIIGYGMYYVMRMTLGVAKHPMIDAGFTPTQLGAMGAGMLIAIAIGKCANGFIADYCNIKKIVPLGLLGAAVVNVILGNSNSYWIFLVLWFLNGCFQSMGSAPCIVSLSQWFSKSQLATYYGVFSIAHYVGEGATYLGTAMIIVAFGWHAAFFVPGIACILLAFIMHYFMRDRPETYGLPTANEFEGEVVQEKEEQKVSAREAQLMVIKNPYVWLLAAAAICLGISRYSISSWGVIFLQEAKGFDLVTAGSIMSLSPILGGVGSFLSGFISDKIFKSHHSVTTIVFGIIMLIGISGVCFVPPGDMMLTAICIAIFGFGLGVILCFVGGLLAVDLCPRKATGAAMGVIGLLAYGGAALQDIVNGLLMDSAKVIVNGHIIYHFNTIVEFWIGSVIVMTLLIVPTLWAKKHKETEDTAA